MGLLVQENEMLRDSLMAAIDAMNFAHSEGFERPVDLFLKIKRPPIRGPRGV